jgi:hypothetical protein
MKVKLIAAIAVAAKVVLAGCGSSLKPSEPKGSSSQSQGLGLADCIDPMASPDSPIRLPEAVASISQAPESTHSPQPSRPHVKRAENSPPAEPVSRRQPRASSSPRWRSRSACAHTDSRSFPTPRTLIPQPDPGHRTRLVLPRQRNLQPEHLCGQAGSSCLREPIAATAALSVTKVLSTLDRP